MKLSKLTKDHIKKAYEESEKWPRHHRPENSTRRDSSEYYAGYCCGTRDLLLALGVDYAEIAVIEGSNI